MKTTNIILIILSVLLLAAGVTFAILFFKQKKELSKNKTGKAASEPQKNEATATVSAPKGEQYESPANPSGEGSAISRYQNN